MNKTATTDLLRLALQSLLIGGGTYGGVRLIHDIAQKASPPERPKNELNLTLPASRVPKIASVSDFVLPAVTGAAGLGGGFLGASAIYEHIRKKQMAQEMQQAQQQYMAALEQAHQKTAELKLPLTDKFLQGMISKVGELAIKEGWSDVKFPTEGPIDTAGHGLWDMVRGVGDTRLGGVAQAAALLTALGTGAGVYYINNQLSKQKEHNKDNTTLPTDIKLNVA